MLFRKIFFSITLAITAWSMPSMAPAQSLMGFCKSADGSCRALAVEVEKRRVSDGVTMRRPTLDPGSLLCGPENPNCCPPELMPVCMAHADVLVDQAVTVLVKSAIAKDCPFSASVCEGFGSFYCGVDQGWNPWSGCQDAIVVRDPEPPTVCPEGQRPAGKPGLCEPISCFHPVFHVEIPCGPNFDDDVFTRVDWADLAGRGGDDALGNLLRLMASDDVQREANKALTQEFGQEIDRLRQRLQNVQR
ncbi:hypothetical protein [Antarctobacter jejuensis]|uniref:hypothetical protein n=1 Tax=Antarctobacter jejuensis TaxID=1439938 RepID=UPI003FD2178C